MNSNVYITNALINAVNFLMYYIKVQKRVELIFSEIKIVGYKIICKSSIKSLFDFKSG